MNKVFGIAEFSIHPGQEADFRARAAECMAAARVDLTGTGAYEWFLTPDGRQCTVLEIYDGLEGMANHIRHVGKSIPKLLEHAGSAVTLLGDVDANMMAKITGKLNAKFGGQRFLGRLRSAAAPDGTVGAQGIYALAQFRLQPGVGPKFRQLAGGAFATVEAREPATVAYEWFMSEDQSAVYAIDIYRDQAALLAHSGNAGTAMSDMRSLAEGQVRLFGGLEGQVRDKYAGRPGLSYVAPRLQGIL